MERHVKYNIGQKGEEGHGERRDIRKSDGSLHWPLSSRRTNYCLSDSKVISNA